MKKKKLAVQKPLQSPITIEDGQNKITIMLQRAFLDHAPQLQIEYDLNIIINDVVAGLPLYTLGEDTRKSLYMHATRVMSTLRKSLNWNKLISAIRKNKTFEHSKFRQRLIDDSKITENDIGFAQSQSGMPLHYWNGRDYIKKRVLPVMDELAKMNALDPNDYTGRNSLRNLAEMEVRYHNHELSLSRQLDSGEKLVVASVHADCSGRCAPFQGKVYSLDSSSGTTDDGRKFEPLEVATDIYYTTKAGKVYKNGLLGFNCRHRLLPYISGVKPEKVNKQEQENQYKINNEQRQRERQIRELKLRAALYKDLDNTSYEEIKGKVDRLNKEYRQFCSKNSRAFYTERLQVLKPSNNEERDKYRVIELKRNNEQITQKIDDFLKNRIDKKNLIVYTNSIGFKSYNIVKHKKTDRVYKPNGVQDIVDYKKQLDKTYYDENGIMSKQIHTSHTHKINGVKEPQHVHEYHFNDKGERISRTDRLLNVEEEKIINEFDRKRKL